LRLRAAASVDGATAGAAPALAGAILRLLIVLYVTK
jgi:hypothetical protein